MIEMCILQTGCISGHQRDGVKGTAIVKQ